MQQIVRDRPNGLALHPGDGDAARRGGRGGRGRRGAARRVGGAVGGQRAAAGRGGEGAPVRAARRTARGAAHHAGLLVPV